jgi:hypothetical protein
MLGDPSEFNLDLSSLLYNKSPSYYSFSRLKGNRMTDYMEGFPPFFTPGQIPYLETDRVAAQLCLDYIAAMKEGISDNRVFQTPGLIASVQLVHYPDNIIKKHIRYEIENSGGSEKRRDIGDPYSDVVWDGYGFTRIYDMAGR